MLASGRNTMTTQYSSAAEALVEAIFDGCVIAVGGFGLSGNPNDLVEGLRDLATKNLTIVSNNMGVDGKGLGLLLESKQVRKVIASYVGENRLFAAQYLSGDVEVEFVPQGTLAERLRAGGAGIPGFYTATGVGTIVADGKPHEEFEGRTYILERAIVADVSLVHAHTADAAGNLSYRHTARNFNPVVATAGKLTIAEAEIVLQGQFIDPNTVITPGIFVDRLVQAVPRSKDIEQRTTRPRMKVSG
jgi:3-oxoacid CoA-transferase subunit A